MTRMPVTHWHPVLCAGSHGPIFLIQSVSTRTGLRRFRRQPASLAVGLASDRSASGADQMRPAGGVAALGGKAVILPFAHGLLHGGCQGPPWRLTGTDRPAMSATEFRRCYSNTYWIYCPEGWRPGHTGSRARSAMRRRARRTRRAAGPGRESAARLQAVAAVVPPRCAAFHRRGRRGLSPVRRVMARGDRRRRRAAGRRRHRGGGQPVGQAASAAAVCATTGYGTRAVHSLAVNLPGPVPWPRAAHRRSPWPASGRPAPGSE